MATRERPADRGRRRGEILRRTIGAELRDARLATGVSQDRLGAAAGVSGSEIGRIERGVSRRLSIDAVSTIATVLGLDLSVRLYPGGDPIRDVASVALLGRLRERIGSGWGWRYEVPVATGDLRAWDAVVTRTEGGSRFVVEAETRLTDVQALLRRLSLKQAADHRARTMVLLVADTRSNRRAVAAAAPILRANFPVTTRRALATLCRGGLPEGDALVVL